MGKLKELQTAEKLIERILEQNVDARYDDMLLYVEVCKLVNPAVLNMSFKYGIQSIRKMGLPTIETVRRSRQKVQARRKDLRGDSTGRDEMQEAYLEFARSK